MPGGKSTAELAQVVHKLTRPILEGKNNMHMIHSDSGMKSKLEIYMAWIAVALLLTH